MIFEEITLENFRQYRGQHKFEFPVQDDRKISLLIARNGVGKTTLLQAFRFCFYGENRGALKLPKSSELITNSLDHRMSKGDRAMVSVAIQFEHAGRRYLAKRSVVFQKDAIGLKKVLPGESPNFELMEIDLKLGMKKVEDGERRINEMIPIGLAHVYMFDGERVEKPISGREFQDGLKFSIVGVLGLEKLQKAYEFLGNKSLRNTVIGKTWAKMEAISESEQAILDRDKELRRANADNQKEIDTSKRNIETLERDIEQARSAQLKIDELKAIATEAELAERKVELKEKDIAELVHKANSLAARLLLKLQVAKLYDKYRAFINSAEKTEEIYENLYSSVIDDILKRGVCICGRPVQPGDKCTENLRQLIALPQDNASYLNNLTALFKSLDDMPAIRKKIEEYNVKIIHAKQQLETLQKDFDRAEQKLKEAEEKRGGDGKQTNIEFLRQNKARHEQYIQQLEREIAENNRELTRTKGKINQIKFSTENNVRVSEAVKMLEELRENIKIELENKKQIARESIQNNMNKVLRGITDQRYANFQVQLDNEYRLTVWNHIGDTDEYEETTEVLSTGQNVVVYLSFLRALLLTINQRAEFSDVSKNGVVMDAALSNVDEEHIKEISTKILSNFDQLIFLSYKGQLRNELIAGIKNNIAKVYELTKDENGDIEGKELPVDNIEDYVNEGEEI